MGAGYGNKAWLEKASGEMATLAPGGRISTEVVEEEVECLREAWADPSEDEHMPLGQMLEGLVDPAKLEEMDLFDRMQLACVIKVCRESGTLSDAGRKLFGSSRERKKTANDADRLRKYLTRFGLSWQDVQENI